MEFIRDAPLGQLLRYIFKNKILLYPEERDDWVCPPSYQVGGIATPHEQDKIGKYENDNDKSSDDGKSTSHTPIGDREQLEKVATAPQDESTDDSVTKPMTRADLENQMSAAIADKGPSRPILPTKTADGNILVDWYTTDDSANPQNWPTSKKTLATVIICVYTTAVYMGSSIYAPAIPGLIAEWGVAPQLASMGLSMYVLGYGLGPMLFSPLSEIPSVGRNPPYIISFFIFVILVIPTALVQNFPGFIVLRFLLGFFGSPCLATGGASLGDIFSPLYIPFGMCLWALSATVGPATAPLISGFSVVSKGWRWSQWEIIWSAGPIFICMLLLLPETSGSTVLYHRAKRIRRRLGNDKIMSQAEIDQANMSIPSLILENLYRPFQMMILDPAVGYTAFYTALIYGIYYSFFEVFPLVYGEIYHFNLGQQGLTFLSITVGVVLAIASYWAYVWWWQIPWVKENGFKDPERRLLPALWATWLCPIGLFLFGWTAREDINWAVPTVGILLFTLGIFVVIQCVFIYLPMIYPQYAASLFAGNDLTRSVLAVAAIHFSTPMFKGLGIGKGCTLLGCLTVGCCGGLVILWNYGAKLRARSRFALN